jgi:hypothetical protein
MKEAEAIFRGAGREDFAKGIAYARKTAVRFLTPPAATSQAEPQA